MNTGWQDWQQQHDVAEFASFFCGRHRVQAVTGEWEARTYVDGVGQPGDAGLSTQPILLVMPSTPPGLAPELKVQSLVDSWYAQEATHAFTVAPSVLLLQLGRFKVVNGKVQKVHTSVTIDKVLWIPIYENANFQVGSVKYRLASAICHHGQHPRAGHYQALLHSANGLWSCDDNRGSRRCDFVPEWSKHRALGCILSPFFLHENEKKITQCIRLFKKDPSSVAKDLLELNDVKGGTSKAIAEKLLRKLASRNLGEVDADWMKVLSTLGQDELSEDDKLTLTLIMAKKRQTEYLADNWEAFCISEWLPAMEIKDIYDLFQELRKRGEAERSPPKRRRRDSSGNSAPSGHSPAYAVGRHLADRLHEASSLEDLHRHRDILVSLYNMQEQPETMAELADWFQKNYAISDSCWAEEVDLTALDALLTTLSLNDCPLASPFRTAMGDLAMAAGRRHQTNQKAAAAFRVAIGAEPTRQEAKVRLLDVLLRSQARGDKINADEVVALMASTRTLSV
ncbi:PRP2 [Symbiodinium sp. CCMP2592]|nr:PRP2 [Symbiodinium sp. CCMP2592]